MRAGKSSVDAMEAPLPTQYETEIKDLRDVIKQVYSQNHGLVYQPRSYERNSMH